MATDSRLGRPSGWQARLRTVRHSTQLRYAGFILAALVGLALSTVHWLGLVAGGALVGLVARTPRRALLGGLAFGLLAWVVFLLLLLLAGSLATFFSLQLFAALSLAIPLGGGLAGALVRVVV